MTDQPLRDRGRVEPTTRRRRPAEAETDTAHYRHRLLDSQATERAARDDMRDKRLGELVDSEDVASEQTWGAMGVEPT